MYGNGIVEVRFCRSHLQSDGETLQHLVGAIADDVQTDNTLLFAERDQLHRGMLFVFPERIELVTMR